MPVHTIPHFYESILFQSRQNPGATAVVFGDTYISYAGLCVHVDNVTRRLQQESLVVGTRLLVDVSHRYLHWLVVLAASRLGLVTASADGVSKPGEMLAMLGTRIIVTDGRTEAPPDSTVLVAGETWLATQAGAALEAVLSDVPADLPARIMFSSGTTGVPKKIALTYGQCDHRMKVFAFDLGSRSRFLSSVSLSTIAGFMYPVRTWSMGGAVIFQSRGERLYDTIVRAGLTHLFLSPAQLAGLVNELPASFLPLPGLTTIVGGGAIARELSQRARWRLTASLFQLYGSTEAGTVAYSHAALADDNPAVTGYVVPGVEAEIIGEDGRATKPGMPGELRIRSPWCVTSYADGEQSDAFRDGWFYPGDIATLSASGLLSIVGRSKELINLGGHKIAPMHIEEALTPHPGVTDIAAFALPGAQGIEQPWVAVVATAEFDQDALAQRLHDRYPELPQLSVAIVPVIPRNTMGKVLRQQLREWVSAARLRR